MLGLNKRQKAGDRLDRNINISKWLLKYVTEVFTVLKDVCKQKVYSLHDF